MKNIIIVLLCAIALAQPMTNDETCMIDLDEDYASAATSSDNNNLYNNRRIRYSNSNRNQQRPDILNSAFDFMNNDAFVS